MLGHWEKEVEGLRSTDWQEQNSYDDVKVQHRKHSQHYRDTSLWSKLGTRSIEGNTVQSI